MSNKRIQFDKNPTKNDMDQGMTSITIHYRSTQAITIQRTQTDTLPLGDSPWCEVETPEGPVKYDVKDECQFQDGARLTITGSYIYPLNSVAPVALLTVILGPDNAGIIYVKGDGVLFGTYIRRS